MEEQTWNDLNYEDVDVSLNTICQRESTINKLL